MTNIPPRIGPAWWNSHWTIVVAIGVGIVLGLVLNQAGDSSVVGFVLGAANLIATVFLRLLKLLVAPLVLFSIMSGVASIADPKSLGRMGLRTFAYYIATSLLAIGTGLLLVNLIRPGDGAALPFSEAPSELPGEAGDLLGVFTRMVPENIFQALASLDMLQIIFFALLAGFVITRLVDPARSRLANMVEAGFELMTGIASVVLSLLPIAVVALLARAIAEMNLKDFVSSLLPYMATVVAGLFVHAVIVLPVLFFLFTRTWPHVWAAAVSPALMTAFSTSSSSATLPVTLETVEERGGVSNKVSSFVLPLGATINMDGTALYECIGTIFLAQYYASAHGFELTLGKQLIVVITALLASIGAAGIPSAGLVMMTIILGALNLPLDGALLLLAVDRPLDMLRTTVNVWSDTVGTAIVGTWEGHPPRVRIPG